MEDYGYGYDAPACAWIAVAHGPTQDQDPGPDSPAGNFKNPKAKPPVDFQAPAKLRREFADKWKGGIAAAAAARGFRMPSGVPGWQHLRILGESLKVVKGLKKGVATAILYLSPSTESVAVDLCPDASEECSAACLGHSSGNLSMRPAMRARLWKTALFMIDRPLFHRLISAEIMDLERKARRKKLLPAVRFDGASDTGYGAKLAAQHPGVQFYDYTKSYVRYLRYLGWHADGVTRLSPDQRLPSNYHLTFSFSGHNEEECVDLLRRGGNVAVVFSARPGISDRVECEPIPAYWNRFPVIDADDTDVRFQDPKGTVAGLRFKAARGRAQALAAAGPFVRDLTGYRGKMLPLAPEKSFKHRNPDDRMRRLERLAASGDPEARAQLQRMQVRTGGLREIPAYLSSDPNALVHYARAGENVDEAMRRDSTVVRGLRVKEDLGNGLAITHGFGSQHGRFAVTHVASGAAVVRGVRLDTARRVAAVVGPLVDWFQPVSSIVNHENNDRVWAAIKSVVPGYHRHGYRENPWVRDGWVDAGLVVDRPGVGRVWTWELSDWGEVERMKNLRDVLHEAARAWRDTDEAQAGDVVTITIGTEVERLVLVEEGGRLRLRLA